MKNYRSDHYIPALDGLRGLAILLVISFHYFGFLPVFNFGWSGVDLFFVLSGYLITGRLTATVNHPGYFANFYRNRVLRIFPLYFGILALFFLGVRVFANENTTSLWAYYQIHWKSFAVFTENWTFIYCGLPPLGWLIHFWTLAVEEQFYLLWPSLIFLFRNAGPRRTMIATVIMASGISITRSLYFSYHPHNGNWIFFYFNTFFRMDSFLIGALLFQLHSRKIAIPSKLTNLCLAASGATLTAAILFLRNAGADQPFFTTLGYTLIALFYASLIHASVFYPGAVLSRTFSYPPLMWIGKISYGLYVFHFPMQTLLQTPVAAWLLKGHVRFANSLSLVICLFLTFLVSSLSYYYFETPFLRMKRTRSYPEQ